MLALNQSLSNETTTKCSQNYSDDTVCSTQTSLILSCLRIDEKLLEFYCKQYNTSTKNYHCTGCGGTNISADLVIDFFRNNVSEFVLKAPDLQCSLFSRSDDVYWTCDNSLKDGWDTVQYDWSFLFVVVFIIAGGIGNILVCLAVLLDRRLQNVTNYFLLSLAIADLLVSLFVMPLGAIPGFLGELNFKYSFFKYE